LVANANYFMIIFHIVSEIFLNLQRKQKIEYFNKFVNAANCLFLRFGSLNSTYQLSVKNMKIKCLFLIALLLSITSIDFAQTKTKPAAIAPDAVVKNFYAAHDAGQGPFFQTKSRALVDRYFAKIWRI